jgi:hypothetical protein
MKRRAMLASAGGLLATLAIASDAAPETAHVVDAPGAAGFRADAPGKFFSRGVATQPGYEFHRVRFLNRPLLEPGLRAMRAFITAQGRPPGALAAVELRLPAPLSGADGAAANAAYAVALHDAGFVVPGDVRPEARSNMAPLVDPPAALSIHAFTFAVPAPAQATPSACDYVISGRPDISDSGEMIAGHDYASAGMQKKAAFILGWLTDRITELGGDPARATGFQIYTRHAIDGIIVDPLSRNPLSRAGFTLVPGDPPGTAFELEFDVRSVSRELVI